MKNRLNNVVMAQKNLIRKTYLKEVSTDSFRNIRFGLWREGSFNSTHCVSMRKILNILKHKGVINDAKRGLKFSPSFLNTVGFNLNKIYMKKINRMSSKG